MLVLGVTIGDHRGRIKVMGSKGQGHICYSHGRGVGEGLGQTQVFNINVQPQPSCQRLVKIAALASKFGENVCTTVMATNHGLGGSRS